MTTPRLHRVTPQPLPDGAALAVEGYATDLLRDFIGLLGAQPALREDLDRLLDTEVQHDRHLPDVGSRDDQFIADTLAALPETATTIRIHGSALGRLAGVLTAICRQQDVRPVGAIPQQREGGAAA